MRHLDKSNIIDEELKDLKLRFELLEGDRKAYYETSQWAIRRNKEEINALRLKNKEYRDSIARVKKHDTASSTSALAPTPLEKLDQKICELHKKYDELQLEAKSKELRLKALQDQCQDLKKDGELVKSNLQDSPQAKEIRMLENRLDKALIKYNEAQSIRKTYEQVVKRLQEERLTFDNQLSTFEKTLKAKKHDSSQLELMSRDANHAKEVAKTELARFEQQINEERKIREKELLSRKELVKQKLEINEKFDKKTLLLDDPNADSNGAKDNSKVQYDDDKEKKLLEYEEAMRLIKEATGVSNIQEVVAKLKSQGDTNSQLSQIQMINETRIEELKKKRAKVEFEYMDLKFSGESKSSNAQRTLQEFEDHMTQTALITQDFKHKYDRQVKLLTNIRSGIQHLYDKLELIPIPEQPPKTTVTDENVIEYMTACEKKLKILSASLQGKELPELIQATNTVAASSTGEVTSILQVSPSVLPAYNTRVKLRPIEFETVDADDENNDDDDSGEVPDRESIKKHTMQLINAKLKSKQTKKVKKKRTSKEEDSS